MRCWQIYYDQVKFRYKKSWRRAIDNSKYQYAQQIRIKKNWIYSSNWCALWKFNCLWKFKILCGNERISSNALKESIAHVAQIVGLENDLSKVVSGFSRKMKRRWSLAIALLGDPQLLILDEPTDGIDAYLRLKIWQELNLLKEKGVGIFVTTHVMDETKKMTRLA